ncbi:MAG TPA: phospholipase D-like domain-containing protein [Acidimicrobiales bacterium]|jgi:phosphatidylserine/phosphatidylglycerophosphate/cardiolipin synthase-like enzyme|nr:phospholipase D-like domain-containing protein [Acidimicrobiales bacterium]
MTRRRVVLLRAGALAVASALAAGALVAGTAPSAVAARHAAARWQVVVEPAAGYGFLDHAVAVATRSVRVEMYELADPAFEAALIAAVHRHVRVQVLLDEDFHAGTVNQPAFAMLRRHHVAVRWADPGVIFHEKAVVIDGAVAYVGSGNLTAEYYATTRDFWVRDTQRADVDAVAAVFGTDWGGGAPASGPPGVDLVWSPNAEPAFLSLIRHAHRSISLESEELSDTYVIDALVAAARRHVAVHVTMTYSSEWRSAFDQLLAAGAQVHLDHGEHPIYVHAKALCVDCTTGPHATGTLVVGSQNLSYGSLAFNRELSIRTSDRAVLAPIAAVLRADFAAAAPYAG